MDDRKNQDEEWDAPEEDTVHLESLRRGNWAESESERILRHMHQFSRKHHSPQPIQDGGSIQLKLLDAYKKEFRQIRVVWRQLNDQASAVDELSMATLRLRLRLPHEVPQLMPAVRLMDVASNNQKQAMPIYLLEKHEVDLQFAKLNGDLVASGHALKRHMGHVVYLKNLESAGFGKTGNANPDPCPVCQCQLGDKWSVLVCGHSFCMECIQLLVAKGQNGS